MGDYLRGVILYSSRYGSTRQYADWIADATGLAAIDVTQGEHDLRAYDFLVIGSPVFYYKLMLARWISAHSAIILSRPTVLFSVSGAGPGPKLDGWIANSLAPEIAAHVRHYGLRGRMDHAQLGWFSRMMLFVGGLFNPDIKAGREERHGFDFMDRDSIAPIVAFVEQQRRNDEVRGPAPDVMPG